MSRLRQEMEGMELRKQLGSFPNQYIEIQWRKIA